MANKRPDDPIAFLANYLINFTKSTSASKNPYGENETENEREKSDNNNNNTNNTDELPDEKIIESFDEYPDSSDGPEAAPTSEDRDEHGQSMLHFACARSHGRNSLIHLIEESGTSITYRDELYRTARDVSIQAGQPDNTKEIDRYVISLAARGIKF